MENVDNKATVSDFLYAENAKEFFAEIDYLLKDGMHFQKLYVFKRKCTFS